MSSAAPGRGVVVTGGAQGIGRAIVERFGNEGAGVVLLDVDGGAAEGTASELSSAGARVLALEGSASVRADLRRAIGLCTREFGRLEALVASAGIAIGRPLLEVSDDEWLEVMEVNLHGVFRSLQEGARAMAGSGGGTMVVISSTNAFHVEQNLAAYNASKGGVVSLVRTAALDLAHLNIRVNAVAPGTVRTRGAEWVTEDPELGPAYRDRIPLKRFGEPTDVAEAVWFLCSPNAGYITGQTLVVDGGYTLGDQYPDLEISSPWRAPKHG